MHLFWIQKSTMVCYDHLLYIDSRSDDCNGKGFCNDDKQFALCSNESQALDFLDVPQYLLQSAGMGSKDAQDADPMDLMGLLI